MLFDHIVDGIKEETNRKLTEVSDILRATYCVLQKFHSARPLYKTLLPKSVTELHMNEGIRRSDMDIYEVKLN